MEEGQAQIRVNGREILFPPAQLTLGEMADAENYFGVDFSQVARSGLRLTAAMLFVAIRRVDPTVTVDDVRGLDPSVLEQLNAAGSGASPPDEAAPSESSEPSANDSSTSSGHSGNGHSPTGSPGLATGTESVPTTSPE